jgi:hypothetical protein
MIHENKPTFEAQLAFTILDTFAGVYYTAGNDTQRKACLKGAEQIIACRLKQIADAQTTTVTLAVG